MESIKGLKRTKMCGEFTELDINNSVTAMGWVQRARNKGSLIFVDLRDRTGIIQIVFDENKCSKNIFDKAKELKFEYVISVTGVIQKRTDINEKLETGTKRVGKILKKVRNHMLKI